MTAANISSSLLWAQALPPGQSHLPDFVNQAGVGVQRGRSSTWRGDSLARGHLAGFLATKDRIVAAPHQPDISAMTNEINFEVNFKRSLG
jgi:hypothetical protein